MDSELVPVYSAANPVEANVVKNALEAEGIRCFLDGAEQAAEVGLSAFAIKLLVPTEDVEKARLFISAHEGGKSANA